MIKKKLTIDEKKNLIDSFQHRFDITSGSDYFFNIWTGETIVENTEEKKNISRKNSLWRRKEPPDKNMKLIKIRSQSYSSRNVPNRLSHEKKDMDITRATILITAASRGYLTRKYVLLLLNDRFKQKLDDSSGYYYYYDQILNTTSWNKPGIFAGSLFLLGTHSHSSKGISSSPTIKYLSDIDESMRTLGALTPRGFPRLHRSPGQLDDAGYKVSYSFSEDMYYKSRKLTFSPVKPIGSSPEKNNKYLKNQYIAPVILEEPPPDISKTGLQEQPFTLLILWMDNEASKVKEFESMRVAVAASDWGVLLTLLKEVKLLYDGLNSPSHNKCLKTNDLENALHQAYILQLYALHNFSRLNVPHESTSDILSGEASETLEYLLCLLVSNGGKLGLIPKLSTMAECNYMMFIFYAFYNIISDHVGRVELFNTRDADRKYPDYGAAWERARDQRWEEIFTSISRYLAFLPTQEQNIVLNKASPGKVSKLIKLSKRGAELAEIIFLCIGTIGRERETREIGALSCIPFIIKGLSLSIDEILPTVNGLRCIYNFCYRNQISHEMIRTYTGTDQMTVFTILDMIRTGSAFADFVVRREYKRLQLTLEDDGWRGNVEEKMSYPTTWENNL